jgi:hypothetical protein
MITSNPERVTATFLAAMTSHEPDAAAALVDPSRDRD